MKLVPLSIITVVVLSGCAGFNTLPEVETKYIDRVEYVVRIPPKELTTLPPLPQNINVDSASQADVAQWVLNNEDYILQLRNQLVGIGKFLDNAQVELDDKAKKENASVLKPFKPFKPLN